MNRWTIPLINIVECTFVFYWARRSTIVHVRRKPTNLGSCQQGERGTVPSRLVSVAHGTLIGRVTQLWCVVRHLPCHQSYLPLLSPAWGLRFARHAARRSWWTGASLLFQLVPADRGANGIRGSQQHILHPRVRGVDDGAAPHQTLLPFHLLEDWRTNVPLAAGDGLHVVLVGWIWE